MKNKHTNCSWCYYPAHQWVLNCVPAVSESKFSTATFEKMASAASMPLFIAVWVPLIFGTFMKPGLQPISSPPGKVSFGMDQREDEKQFLTSCVQHYFKLFFCFISHLLRQYECFPCQYVPHTKQSLCLKYSILNQQIPENMPLVFIINKQLRFFLFMIFFFSLSQRISRCFHGKWDIQSSMLPRYTTTMDLK